MAKKKKTTTSAVKILHKRYIKDDPKRLKSLKIEREKSNIAEQIYNLRMQAGLSQKEFAKRVGTTQSVISRLEDADYNGYRVTTLERIAEAMHQRLRFQFIPESPDYTFA